MPTEADSRPAAGKRLAALLLLLLAACEAPGGSRFSRHFEAGPWITAANAQLDNADRLVPDVGSLALVPVGFLLDSDVNEDTPGHVSSGTQSVVDGLPVGMGLLASTVGVIDWAHGDSGARFEVAAESLGATAFLTTVLKKVVHRSRPAGASTSSFPSGHMSFTTAAATLLVQDVQDANGGETPAWAWALYLPAVYVGAERVQAHRHWISDVAFAGFLGVLLPNLIHDAHFPGTDPARETILGASRARWAFGPSLDEDGHVALALQLSF